MKQGRRSLLLFVVQRPDPTSFSKKSTSLVQSREQHLCAIVANLKELQGAGDEPPSAEGHPGDVWMTCSW